MTVSELVSLMKQWHMLFGTKDYLQEQIAEEIEEKINKETLMIGVDSCGYVLLYLDIDVHGHAVF